MGQEAWWGHLGGHNTIFEGVQEQSRLKITNELRRFLEADDRESVKMDEMDKPTKAIKIGKPKFNKQILPNAIIREEVNKLTLQSKTKSKNVANVHRYHNVGTR